MSRVYISDTNMWIDFENGGLLDELFRLPFKFCCTEFVVEELSPGTNQTLLDLGLIVEAIDADNIMHLFSLMDRHNNSSLADVSCFFLAKLTGLPLLTGDRKLREQAT